MILGIDPGTTESGWVNYDEEAKRVTKSGISPNHELLDELIRWYRWTLWEVAIESIESSRGMPVGADTFTTVRWIGRFQQATRTPEKVMLIDRRTIKEHLCGNSIARDSNVRQALLDIVGPVGTKGNQGPTYGVKSHAWAALAVAVTAAHRMADEAV